MNHRSIARAWVRWSARLLPPERAAWGEAMSSELEHIDEDDKALAFAAGCLGASLWANVAAAPPGVRLGRAAVALVTVAYALFHLQAAMRGIGVLAGAPDPHYARLLRRSGEAAETYRALRPFTVSLMAGTGATHLAAALFLVAWRPRLFWGALALGGFFIGAFHVALYAIEGSGAWPFQLLPLLLLGAAGAALARWAKPGAGAHN